VSRDITREKSEKVEEKGEGGESAPVCASALLTYNGPSGEEEGERESKEAVLNRYENYHRGKKRKGGGGSSFSHKPFISFHCQ